MFLCTNSDSECVQVSVSHSRPMNESPLGQLLTSDTVLKQ